MASPDTTHTVGIIGGSSLLKSEVFQHGFGAVTVSTPFGPCVVHVPDGSRVENAEDAAKLSIDWSGATRRFLFVQRHRADPAREYSQPHAINTRAIVAACVKLGCERVVAFASVGSMRPEWPLGTIVLTEDFFHFPGAMISAFEDGRAHFVPDLAKCPIRAELAAALTKNGIEFKNGIYAQANGPRFETRAEIRFLSTVADVVGMTAAVEVTLLLEQQVDCALVCVIDNPAHGIELHHSDDKLESIHDFHAGVDKNQAGTDRLSKIVIQTCEGMARSE